MKNLFPIIVDYSKSLDKMIKAGNYYCVNPENISQGYFLIQGQGKHKLSIELVHYGKYMKSNGVIRDLNSRSLRPATLPELLAFGAKYPKIQRKFPIVALGSVAQNRLGDRYVVYLGGSVSGRVLIMMYDGSWEGNYRFAAVNK